MDIILIKVILLFGLYKTTRIFPTKCLCLPFSTQKDIIEGFGFFPNTVSSYNF